MTIKAVGDFQDTDIDELMNTPTEVNKKPTIDEMFEQYDRELLSFDSDITQTRTWPAPIRKRVCIK